ncbi:hypothetical protein IW261DRAFT_1641146 [Armillaria novae-zelandiae]|uniref:F-box domain-containing protein n=1 Tax=Armillaria novae-zelandiae TaxID=153914 RepID=A0AA39PU58_9AGAR|nr:hypothetical protein IW261DRAFT_1641146 [Armillaria novae-zelandiae]
MEDTVPGEVLPLRRVQDKYPYPPSFSRLLQNNDPPSADLDATCTIPNMMVRAADDIALAKKEIQSLRIQIKEKEVYIWALNRVIDDCNAVLSPIRRLPTDIILEIFRAVVQERYDVFEITRGPWILTHVCKKWRTLACTYGALWSSANITNVMSQWKTFSPQNPSMLLHTALKRSGTFLLSVWFDYKIKKSRRVYRVSEIYLPSMDSDSGELSASTDDNDSENVLSNRRRYGINGQSLAKLSTECQLVTVLMAHSRRLKHLNINVSTPPALRCLRALNGGLDHLETLHIHVSFRDQIHNEIQEFLSVAPMLHSVYLNELPLASVLHLPLTQLRFLDHQLMGMRADEWRTTVQIILLQGSRLTDYGPPSPPALYNSDSPRIDNALIRTFRVRDWYVLDYFRLPGIYELHIYRFGRVDCQTAGETLSDFVHRSRCTLRKLRLRGIPDSILSALPSVHKSLVELEITLITSNTNLLLSGLSAFMREPGHFPRLSRLEIKVSNEICFYHDILSEYLKQIYTLVDDLWNARIKVRLEVGFSVLNFSHAHQVCDVRKYRCLRDEGLDIAVFAARKSNWLDTMDHGEDEDIEDLRDILLDEDSQDDGSDSEDDDFEDDDGLGEESEEC